MYTYGGVHSDTTGKVSKVLIRPVGADAWSDVMEHLGCQEDVWECPRFMLDLEKLHGYEPELELWYK